MEKTLPFEDFWKFTEAQNKNGNGLYYHPCCDVWSTRNSKAKRASHSQFFQWQKIISTLDRSISNKKQALQAMMHETGIKIPVVVNKACFNKSSTISSKISPNKLQEDISSEDNIEKELSHKNIVLESSSVNINIDKGMILA